MIILYVIKVKNRINCNELLLYGHFFTSCGVSLSLTQFFDCIKYLSFAMFSLKALNGKGDNTGRDFDNLRQMLSSKYNGLSTKYLDGSHIPTLPSTIESFHTVDTIKKNKQLIWLQSSCQSNILEEETDLNYFSSWHDKNYELIQVHDESNERAFIFLDRHPAKKHPFVSLLQLDEKWNHINNRNKLIDYGLLGVSLFHNKNRSNVSHPNNGYQFFVDGIVICRSM